MFVVIQVTPRTSTSSAYPGYQEEMSYESLPSDKMDKKAPPSRKPLQFLAPGQQTIGESDEDTFFDDESFDTLDDLDDNSGQKPVIPPKPRPKRNKPPEPTQAEIEAHKKAIAQNDPNLQSWLTEQAVLLKERERDAGPIAHSTPPTTKKNLQTFQAPSPPPPRPERNFSSSSTDTVKSKPLPQEPKPNTKVHMGKTSQGQTIITMRPRRDGDTTTEASDSTYTANTTTTEDVYSADGRPISDVSDSTVASSGISSVSQRREKNNNEPPKVKPRVVPRKGKGEPPPLPPKAVVKVDDGSSTEDSSSSYSDSESDASTEISVVPPKVPPKQVVQQKQPPPTPEKPKPKPKEVKPKPVIKPVVEQKQKAKSPASPKKFQKKVSKPESPDVSFSSGDEDEADAQKKPTIKIEPVGPKYTKAPEPVVINQQSVFPPQQVSPLTQHNLQGVSQLQNNPEEDSVAMEYKFFKSNKEIITSTGSDIQASVERKMVYNQHVVAQQQQQAEQQRHEQQMMLDQREQERKAQQERLRQQEIKRVRMIQQQAEQARQLKQQQEEQQRQQKQAMQTEDATTGSGTSKTTIYATTTAAAATTRNGITSTKWPRVQ